MRLVCTLFPEQIGGLGDIVSSENIVFGHLTVYLSLNLASLGTACLIKAVRGIVNMFPDCVCNFMKNRQKLLKFRTNNQQYFTDFVVSREINLCRLATVSKADTHRPLCTTWYQSQNYF